MSEVTANKQSNNKAIIIGRSEESRPDFAAIKKAFIEWLATPEPLRSPDTQRRFAAKHGVHETTVSLWAGDPEVQTAKDKLVMRYADCRYAEIMKALCDGAAAGEPSLIKMYLQFIKGWSEKVEHKMQVEDFRVKFGDEQYAPARLLTAEVVQ